MRHYYIYNCSLKAVQRKYCKWIQTLLDTTELWVMLQLCHIQNSEFLFIFHVCVCVCVFSWIIKKQTNIKQILAAYLNKCISIIMYNRHFYAPGVDLYQKLTHLVKILLFLL